MAKRKAPRARGRKKASKGSARKKSLSLRKQARKGARKALARKGARKPAARKAIARKRTSRKATARKVTSRKAVARKVVPKRVQARKAPALNRERRTVREEEMVPMPPSSLDLDRTASAARSGRRELHEKFTQHTETSPAITGGDIDADWESAYSVGDEAPGGDNPTPDQDIVDDIGKALGVEYEDNEELKGEKKISDRDKKRWELDPASSDDYDDR